MKRQRFLMVAGTLSAVYVVWLLLEGIGLQSLVHRAAPLGVMLAAAAAQPMIALVCAGMLFLLNAVSAVTSLIGMLGGGMSLSWLVSLVVSYAPMLLISGMWVAALLQQKRVGAAAMIIAVAAAVFYFGREIYYCIAYFGLSPLKVLNACLGVLPYAAFAIAAQWDLSPRA